jgi:hypothetical protein
VALVEPAPFIQALLDSDAPATGAAIAALRLFLLDLSASWFYRRAGLFAALSLRWSASLVWHLAGAGGLG